MASRSIATELVRFLHGLTVPVCLFDEDRRLVFANQSCTDWAAIALDDLIGQTASYTSAAKNDPAASALDRLCPPPESFAGRRQSGMIHAVGPDGQLHSLRADFHPLSSGSTGSSAVLVLAAAAAEAGERDASPSPPGSNDDAQLLHERLLRFQHEQCDRYRLDRLVGDSPAMLLARAQMRSAITSNANATIVGPPGSGREQLARTIHYAPTDPARNHELRSHALLPLDGSLLTGELLAAAVNALSAQGRAPQATLLLLHVDRLSLEMQTELVRVFVHRFEGLRLLATSEAVPDVLVSQSRLHPLLAAAISTLVIHLPPLSDRRKDIPLIAQLAVEELNSEGKKQVRGISADAIDALVAYSWPGNAAELRGMVAEAFQRAEGTEVTLADFPQRLSHAAGVARRPARSDEPIALAEFLTSIERELIERALKQAKGNKARAARLLGLTRPRLYRRMVQLGLAEAAPQAGEYSPASSRRPGPRAAPPVTTSLDQADQVSLSAASDSGNHAAADDEADFIENIPFEEQTE